MFRDVMRPLMRTINAFCVVLLAGMYVFTYYDYLHTITQNDLVEVSAGQSQPANSQLGVIVVHQEISYR